MVNSSYKLYDKCCIVTISNTYLEIFKSKLDFEIFSATTATLGYFLGLFFILGIWLERNREFSSRVPVGIRKQILLNDTVFVSKRFSFKNMSKPFSFSDLYSTHPTRIPPFKVSFFVSGSGRNVKMAGPLPECPSSFDTLTFIVYESAPFEQAEALSTNTQNDKKHLRKKFISKFMVLREVTDSDTLTQLHEFV